jgi:tetratricopeptide (TPR) repeat protein
MADPGPQLAKVLEFRKKLEQTRKVLYRGFTDDAAFKLETDKHLVAFARGEIEKPSEDKRVPLLPESALEEISKAKAEAKRALEEAEKVCAEAKDGKARAEAAASVAEIKAAKTVVTLAEKAAKAALEGKIEEARQDFAIVLDGTTNLHVLYLGYDFFKRIGELDEAERLLHRWLALSGPDAQTGDTAPAYGNLGLIYRTRGDLAEARKLWTQSGDLYAKIGMPDMVKRVQALLDELPS